MDDENTRRGAVEGDDGEVARTETVRRTPPQVKPARAKLVEQWTDRVQQAASVHEKRFKQIRELQSFVKGKQWGAAMFNGIAADDAKYVVNLTLRHVSQRVANLYAKNPKAIARVRKRLENKLWDGKPESVLEAKQTLDLVAQAQGAVQQGPAGQAEMEAIRQQAQKATELLQDYEQAKQRRTLYHRLAMTVELVYDYNIDEQALSYKTMLKKTVRRAVTTGIGWVKLGFQRATQLKPEYESRIADMATNLRRIEQVSADIADGKLMPDSAEAEHLRLEMQMVQEEGTVLIREGLTFDYPNSTSIIPDLNCRCLKTFLGCRWVAQQYLLPATEIQRIYGVDVGSSSATKYHGRMSSGEGESYGSHGFGDASEVDPKSDMFLVSEIWCKDSGLVFDICHGFPDFLREPSAPEVWTERFWPWFGLVLNEIDQNDEDEDIWPPSDVELIRDAQLEINRSREGLREHRIANRPAYATPTGMLSDPDKEKLRDREAHAILELQALQPGQNVQDVIQPMAGAPIDPNLYQTNAQFEDILRAGGHQEADLGGTSGSTATESSIAASALSSANNSSVDDLDEMLTGMARAAGQILLLEVSKETVSEIVGPGAVWPDLSKEQVARELWLEIEAGSTGRPNQASEIANAERLYPLLMQIPGVDPTELARDLIRRLDDRLDIDRMLAPGIDSVVKQNQNQQPGTGDPGTDPNAQGAQGAQNAAQPAAPPGPPLGVDTTSAPPNV